MAERFDGFQVFQVNEGKKLFPLPRAVAPSAKRWRISYGFAQMTSLGFTKFTELSTKTTTNKQGG